VLVIEQDPLSSEAVAGTIEELGHELDWASSGKEAMDKLTRSEFDVVLLDVFLPDFSATRLIPELKRIRSDIGIIPMAERNSRDLEREIRRLGILYYMTKPVSSVDLKDLLNHVSKRLVHK